MAQNRVVFAIPTAVVGFGMLVSITRYISIVDSCEESWILQSRPVYLLIMEILRRRIYRSRFPLQRLIRLVYGVCVVVFHKKTFRRSRNAALQAGREHLFSFLHHF